MTAMHLFHSAILAFGHMEEELSTACRAAANALEILSNLRPGFTRNVIPRMNSTALSVSQPNSEDRQVNNEELQSNERSTSPASSSSIQARLATLFPTVGSNRASRKSTSRRPARSKQLLLLSWNLEGQSPLFAIHCALTTVKLKLHLPGAI